MQTHKELCDELENRALFSIPDAARLLGCDERTLRRAVTTGKIPSTKIGAKLFVPTTWLRQQANPS